MCHEPLLALNGTHVYTREHACIVSCLLHFCQVMSLSFVCLWFGSAVEIVDVHVDAVLDLPYYTIRLPDGTKKQTNWDKLIPLTEYRKVPDEDGGRRFKSPLSRRSSSWSRSPSRNGRRERSTSSGSRCRRRPWSRSPSKSKQRDRSNSGSRSRRRPWSRSQSNGSGSCRSRGPSRGGDDDGSKVASSPSRSVRKAPVRDPRKPARRPRSPSPHKNRAGDSGRSIVKSLSNGSARCSPSRSKSWEEHTAAITASSHGHSGTGNNRSLQRLQRIAPGKNDAETGSRTGGSYQNTISISSSVEAVNRGRRSSYLECTRSSCEF